MPKPPKSFAHHQPFEICTSVQRGLPFVITPYMEYLLKGLLAAAQTKYNVTICHLIVMANHIHMLIVVEDPADVPRFMGHFKTEAAHVLNKLMGTTGETFWCDGYDSPQILSPECFLDRMAYLYLNPVEARLTDRARDYKGISTYNNLINGNSTETWRKISRDQIPTIPEGKLSRAYQAELLEELQEARGLNYKLEIKPWAWLECFEHSKSWKKKDVLTRFLAKLRECEENREKTTLIPEYQQLNREIRTPYRSKRSGKKTLCLSHCPEQRKSFIAKKKSEIALARDSWKRRISGDRSALPPPGFFLPGGALLSNIAFPELL